MNKNKESIWDDTEVELTAEDLGLYEIDPFDVTHDLGYYDLELVLPVADTRTLCLPVSWYSYIVNGNGCYFQVDCELIESTLKDYGYTVKDFVKSTENPFLYEFNGCMASCLEYTFMVNTQESDRFI